MDPDFTPALGQQAWAIVHHLRGGDKLSFDPAANVHNTYDPTGTYSSQRFPSSAVRQLIAEGVIGEDLELTSDGRAWIGVAPDHLEMDHEGIVARVRLARQIQAANLPELEDDLKALAQEIDNCAACRAVGNTARL